MLILPQTAIWACRKPGINAATPWYADQSSKPGLSLFSLGLGDYPLDFTPAQNEVNAV